MILLQSCGCRVGFFSGKSKIDTYIKKQYNIPNGNIFAAYGILDASKTLHSKDYFLVINDQNCYEQYIKKLAKANYQIIEKKSKEKAKKLSAILKDLQNRYKIFHPNFIKDINTKDLIALDETAKHIPLFKPLPNSIVTSSFGMRKHPIKCKRYMHNGIDIAGPKKSFVYAAAEGIVEKAEFSKSYGYNILIKHKYNFKTRYAHLSKLLVKKGDIILTAKHIGNQGATGATKREHLHFEIIHNNKHLNPWNFIKYD